MPADFSVAEWSSVKLLSPLPALPADPTNKFADNAAAATLGQRLFFDKTYSGALAVGDDTTNGGLGAVGDKGKISCASCHLGAGLDDQRSKPNNVSLGADYGSRNALTMTNASYYKWVNWAGRFSSQWELPLAVVENAKNMNSDRLRIVHFLFDKYKAEYEAIFGALDPALGSDAARFPASGKPKANAAAADGAWEGMTAADRMIVNTAFVNFAKSLQAYMRKLTVKTSRFDRFVAGSFTELTADERAGLKLFNGKAACSTCHSGPNFTDDGFHALGVPQTGPRVPAVDNGRFADVPPLLASPFNSAGSFSDDKVVGAARLAGLTDPPPDSAKGQFRTPSLRNVSRTAPYMHAGQFATLEDVIAFYDQGGGTATVGAKELMALNLTATEKAQLVAFLKALDLDALPAAILANTAAN